MLRRQGTWYGVLCVSRSRNVAAVRSPAIASSPEGTEDSPCWCISSISHGSDTNLKQRGYPLPRYSAALKAAAATSPLLVAPSDATVHLRAAAHATEPFHWPGEASARTSSRYAAPTLRAAAASRDAFQLFLALLQPHRGALDGDRTTVEELTFALHDVEGEAELLASSLCACVAVTLHPRDWPPWVTARFATTGVAAMPVAPNAAPIIGTTRASAPTAVSREDSSPTATSVPASPLHHLAAHTLQGLMRQLPPSTAGAAASARVSLLRWLGLLCGVCLAPNADAAMRLAMAASVVSLDAAGAALAAHCAAHVVTVTKASIDSQLEGEEELPTSSFTQEETREARWLQLWAALKKPSSACPPSLPPFVLPSVRPARAADTLMDGLTTAALREWRVSWHLHCFVSAKEVRQAARLLVGACQDSQGGESASSPPSASPACVTGPAEDGCTTTIQNGAAMAQAYTSATLPVVVTTQAELLASLPTALLDEDHLGARLARSLLTHIRLSKQEAAISAERREPKWHAVPSSMLFLPAVADHAVLYGRMLQYLLASTAQANHAGGYQHHLQDLTLLLSSASAGRLAASLIPAQATAASELVAETDTHRATHMRQLVQAILAVVENLCAEPTPQLLSNSTTSGDVYSPLYSSNVTSSRRRWRREAERTAAAHARQVAEAAASPAAVTWRWREDVMPEVDATIAAAVRLLSSVLERCSSRTRASTLRRAEPRWRRQLRERTAVRAHRLELLLPELPHAELRAVLHALLGHGYTREGSRLGLSLLAGDQVDLRYYPLPLLGSLYLAVGSTSAPTVPASATDAANTPDAWKSAVYRIYRRRFELYGDADFNTSSPSYTALCDGGAGELSASSTRAAAASTTTALTLAPENTLVEMLVQATTVTGDVAGAELANCLLNRRAGVVGGSAAVDVGRVLDGGVFTSRSHGVFHTWLRKGSTTL